MNPESRLWAIRHSGALNPCAPAKWVLCEDYRPVDDTDEPPAELAMLLKTLPPPTPADDIGAAIVDLSFGRWDVYGTCPVAVEKCDRWDVSPARRGRFEIVVGFTRGSDSRPVSEWGGQLRAPTLSAALRDFYGTLPASAPISPADADKTREREAAKAAKAHAARAERERFDSLSVATLAGDATAIVSLLAELGFVRQ